MNHHNKRSYFKTVDPSLFKCVISKKKHFFFLLKPITYYYCISLYTYMQLASNHTRMLNSNSNINNKINIFYNIFYLK